MWLLKSLLNQNLRVIYQKFNDNFKCHINFEETKKDKRMLCSITHLGMINIRRIFTLIP
jgi:hypothetical protein